MSQRFGNWECPVGELWTGYEFPQEAGNRTDVRWVRFSNAGSQGKGGQGVGLTARFGDHPVGLLRRDAGSAEGAAAPATPPS